MGQGNNGGGYKNAHVCPSSHAQDLFPTLRFRDQTGYISMNSNLYSFVGFYSEMLANDRSALESVLSKFRFGEKRSRRDEGQMRVTMD